MVTGGFNLVSYLKISLFSNFILVFLNLIFKTLISENYLCSRNFT